MIKINLGCGHKKMEGYLNLDIDDRWHPEILCDLNKQIPMGTNTVDEIFTSHTLEHLSEIDNVMFEIHRVCRPNASVTIVVPIGESWLNWPQHKTPFGEESYKYFESLLFEGNPAFTLLYKEIKKDKELKLILEVLK